MSDTPTPSPPAPGTPPHRSWWSQRSSGAKTVLIILGLSIAISVYASTQSNSGEGSGSTLHIIRYEVTGEGTDGADITFQNENADTSQQAGRALPWIYGFEAREGTVLYISGQNIRDAGAITCTIFVDGTAAETNTSTGAYTICTASGSL